MASPVPCKEVLSHNAGGWLWPIRHEALRGQCCTPKAHMPGPMADYNGEGCHLLALQLPSISQA